MLLAVRRPRPSLPRLGRRVAGLSFLLVLVLLVALSVAVYQQRFTPVVSVTLMTDSIGNELQSQSDVKIRGLIVGEVRSISTAGDGARIQLALQPAAARNIPADVSARLLPKTLFGERYVELVLPANAPQDGPAIAGGDVIPQDRSSSAIELEQVFDDLLPLLQTVKPAELSATLNAMATALDGRGRQLGQNLVQLDTYLKGINPQLPTITSDIRRLTSVATTYSQAVPDLLTTVKNLSATSDTLVAKQDALGSFLSGVTGLASTATSVLQQDGDRIIQVGQVSRPTLETLARYSPEFPCLTQGLTAIAPRLTQAFGHDELHITLEVVTPRPAYQQGQEPVFADTSGPDCRGLPKPAGSQAHPYQPKKFDDGVNGSGSTTAGSDLPGALSMGDAGTPAEQRVTDALFAPELGAHPAPVSDLLLGPMVRGTVVNQS
jgi:phospholipid/cholesterol/gamma-HCH transport system substrate-binding protein